MILHSKNPFNVSFVYLAFHGMCFENTQAVTKLFDKYKWCNRCKRFTRL